MNYSLAPQVEVVGQARPWEFLKSVFALYRSHFFRWFGITAPTSLLAAGILWIVDQRVKAILRNIPLFELPHHQWEIAGTVILRLGGYFLSWFLGCFALAAIATVVSNLNDDEDDDAWRRDSHQQAREHFGKLVLVAVFTSSAFLLGLAMLQVVVAAIGRVVGWSHFLRYSYAALLVGSVVVASVTGWLGMTIPIVVRGNSRVWAARKRSIELSNGYEGAIFWLIVQSVVGSYVAGYATYYGLRLFFPVHLRYTLWYGWLVFIVAILAGAAVEPPIFIGFSLLADPEQLKASSLPGSQHASDIH